MADRYYGNTLQKEFQENFLAVKKFYSYPPPDQEILQNRREEIKNGVDRTLLVNVLRQYNSEIGAPSPVLENIDLLSNPRTAVIIGGQQAGLFTGPLYTMYKALDIISRAQKAREIFDFPVVPVFWVTSEDHDFREVNHVRIINTENQIEKISLEGPFRTRPVGHIPCKKVFMGAVTELDQIMPSTEYKQEFLELLRQSGEESRNLGEWFSRIMVRLMGGWGLVLFDPLAVGTEKIKEEFLNFFWPAKDDFYQALSESSQDLERAGFSPQVKKDPQHASFFVIHNKERRPIYLEGKHFRSRGGDLYMEEKEFWHWLKTHAEIFSPDALLRPVFQDFIFPVLATVNGPGEIAYQAQLKEAYSALGLEQPPLYPRRSLTIVEEKLLRHLDSWGISPGRFLEDEDSLWSALVAQETGIDLENIFGTTRSEIEASYRRLIEELENLHPNLRPLGEKNLKRILKEVEYLKGRSQEMQREKEQVIWNRYQKIRTHLFPRGNMQERVLNVFPFLIRYGPHFISILKDGIQVLDRGHGFLTSRGEWR